MKRIGRKITLSSFCLLILSACLRVGTETSSPMPIPTLDASFDGWQEYSSEYTYSSIDTLETGFLKYIIHYPPGWYLYPGSTISEPGLEGQTYIQNFKRIGDDLQVQPEVTGTVKLTLYALPCEHSMDSCPTGLPELAPGLPGRQEINIYSDWTVWTTFLYTRGFVIFLTGFMKGTPEENADLIETLDKILSAFFVYDGGLFPPERTPTPGPTYPVGPVGTPTITYPYP